MPEVKKWMVINCMAWSGSRLLPELFWGYDLSNNNDPYENPWSNNWCAEQEIMAADCKAAEAEARKREAEEARRREEAEQELRRKEEEKRRDQEWLNSLPEPERKKVLAERAAKRAAEREAMWRKIYIAALLYFVTFSLLGFLNGLVNVLQEMIFPERLDIYFFIRWGLVISLIAYYLHRSEKKKEGQEGKKSSKKKLDSKKKAPPDREV